MNEQKPKKSGAYYVGLGIFLSRIAGLVRERVFAHFFGNSFAADAFKAALKIPNFLQNLLGEGVLSASFIPVYAKTLKSDEKKANELVAFVGTLLFLIVSVLSLVGVYLSPWIVNVTNPGFPVDKQKLTAEIVQILFPGTGILVMSAWCLGILNSHKKFFLSYFAPVLWNLAMIGVLLYWGSKQDQLNLAMTLAWGFVLGSFLQFLVQLPMILKLVRQWRLNFNFKESTHRSVLNNFFPVVGSRGVVQVSSFIDSILASFLPSGAVSAIAYAQILYMLPISLFGMSVSAAELPEMSQLEHFDKLHARLQQGRKQIQFFVVPSMFAFLFIGNAVVGLIFQSGKFSVQDNWDVWMVLIGYAIGLVASSVSRLYSSSFYALQDPETPLFAAMARVAVSFLLSGGFILYLIKNPELHFGAAAGLGITLASGISSYLEHFYLKKLLAKKIGAFAIWDRYFFKTVGVSVISSALGAGAFALIKTTMRSHVLEFLITIVVYGISYLGMAYLFKLNRRN